MSCGRFLVLFFFFLITRPPPTSTLFPYTTLFRSLDPYRHDHAPPGAGAAGRAHRLHRAIDRKSTRLNSSHVEISYAVFCLKKKKNSHHIHSFIKKKKKH